MTADELLQKMADCAAGATTSVRVYEDGSWACVSTPTLPDTAMHSGQALVEFALVLPLLLVLVLGGIAAGIVVLDRYTLTHAATEGATAGAGAGGDCTVALDAARAVLGRSAAAEDCSSDGTVLVVTLRDDLDMPVPFGPDVWTVEATGRSLLP